MRIYVLATALSAVLCAFSANTPYSPDFKSGVLPGSLTVENANSLLPLVDGYKTGYTENGWMVERYGSTGYVALSPTYTGSDEACCNIMSLPELTLSEGDYLRWQTLSVHPDFPDSYSVEIKCEGQTINLMDVNGESPLWTTHLVDLSEFAGKDVVISFVCKSRGGYMLALDNVNVGKLPELSFAVADDTDVYYGPQSLAPVSISVVNTGAEINGGSIAIAVNNVDSDNVAVEGVWKPGETRVFEFEVPLELNKQVDYDISYVADGVTPVQLSSRTLYSSYFKKRLVIDKATGMWCNNCPTGDLTIETLTRQFGQALIPLNTHIYSGTEELTDKLANKEYFANLNYYSVPYMKLNRIKNSAASSDKQFSNYYYKPTQFQIGFGDLRLDANESATVSVFVECSEDFDNSNDRYRVAYVLTSDFYCPEDEYFIQRNNLLRPSYLRFYYLPSKIHAPLCKFKHVTVSSANAFSGFENSLPAELKSSEVASYSWSFDRPELVDDIKSLSVVAMVLDTESGEILAAEKLEVAEPQFSGVCKDPQVMMPELKVASDGGLSVSAANDDSYTVEVYTTDGICRSSVKACGNASIATGLSAGLYVVRIKCGDSVTVKKIVL